MINRSIFSGLISNLRFNPVWDNGNKERMRERERELKVEDDIKSCGREWEKAAGPGAACWVFYEREGCPCEEGWVKVMEIEEHSLLQGLHPHFLIMQLLLHLGQLLLQSAELWTQGRAAGYRSAQWAPLTTTCQKRLVMTVQTRNAWLWLHTRTKSIFMVSQTEHKICATS